MQQTSHMTCPDPPYGIRNVLTGCVLREAIAYFATHFEGALRIAYCVLRVGSPMRSPL
jgi:hypothetical protein